MDVPDSLTRHRSAFNQALESILQDRTTPLFLMMRHQLGWDDDQLVNHGKYLRPSLVLLTAEACGADWQNVIPGAVALELLHNFSLIHDDIQDESPLRRDRPTVWTAWGASQAINAGDGMYALSRLVLLGLRDNGVPDDWVFRAAQMLDETCLALCEGQYADLAFQDQVSVSLDDYEMMIGQKTAAAFQCAFEMGAVLAEGEGPRSRMLGEAGRQLGLAYQMRDDVLDLWGGEATGKEVALDVRRGKKSLPVVYGLSRGGVAEGRRLREIYGGAFTDETVEEVVRLLEALGAPAYCAQQAEPHWQQAQQLIRESGLPDDSASTLIQAGQFLMTRAF